MERLASLLAKQNPEQAAKLRLAWQRSKSDQNLRFITEIENLIREGHFTEAMEKQKDLSSALQRVLDILLDRARESGATLITVTHDRDLLDRFERVIDFRELGVDA